MFGSIEDAVKQKEYSEELAKKAFPCVRLQAAFKPRRCGS